HMTKYELVALGDGFVAPGGNKAVVAAGTGLGTAGLCLIDGRWRAVSGAAMLATLPIAIGDAFPFGDMADAAGFVPAGRVLCGKGLVTTYQRLGGKAAKPTPESITATGLDGTDPEAQRTLDLMGRWL